MVAGGEVGGLVASLAEEDGSEDGLAVAVASAVVQGFVRIAGVLARTAYLLTFVVEFIFYVGFLDEVEDELHGVHLAQSGFAGLTVDVAEHLVHFVCLARFEELRDVGFEGAVWIEPEWVGHANGPYLVGIEGECEFSRELMVP